MNLQCKIIKERSGFDFETEINDWIRDSPGVVIKDVKIISIPWMRDVRLWSHKDPFENGLNAEILIMIFYRIDLTERRKILQRNRTKKNRNKN